MIGYVVVDEKGKYVTDDCCALVICKKKKCALNRCMENEEVVKVKIEEVKK